MDTRVNNLSALFDFWGHFINDRPQWGLCSEDYTKLLLQFIMWITGCTGKGLMRYEVRLQPPTKSLPARLLRFSVLFSFSTTGSKQENAIMMSSCVVRMSANKSVHIIFYCTVQISVGLTRKVFQCPNYLFAKRMLFWKTLVCGK